jgi:hypothetical protein
MVLIWEVGDAGGGIGGWVGWLEKNVGDGRNGREISSVHRLPNGQVLTENIAGSGHARGWVLRAQRLFFG